jgi:hypothetical protein
VSPEVQQSGSTSIVQPEEYFHLSHVPGCVAQEEQVLLLVQYLPWPQWEFVVHSTQVPLEHLGLEVPSQLLGLPE